MGSNKKLTVELVPKSCWWSSVRTTVKPAEWDKIRFISYEAANHKCEICGEIGKNQGYKHNVECHEIWEYDDENKIQKLKGLISLCPICHQVKHIGRAIAMGRHKDAYSQLMKVNKWTLQEVEQHVLASFELHKERSKYEWDLDLSILTEEPYSIKLKNFKTRIFKVKKYKKKYKRKTTKTKTAAKKTAAKRKVNKRPPKKKQ
jgi:hypothetical protein